MIGKHIEEIILIGRGLPYVRRSMRRIPARQRPSLSDGRDDAFAAMDKTNTIDSSWSIVPSAESR